MKFKLESARYSTMTEQYAKALSASGFAVNSIVTDNQDDDTVYEIEVDNMESLVKIMQITNNRIVLNNSTILIYDYYIE
jgi:hypothetical protein